MRRACAVAAAGLLALAAAGAARADDGPGMAPATARACAAVAGLKPPPADLPTREQAAALAGCDAEALYFGIGRAADPAAARRCTFLGRGDGQAAFAGDALLMTIYANGIGAGRDLRYATHLACGLDAAAAERDGRVANLAGKAASHWTGHDFSYCDDATSGSTAGVCAAHDRRIALAVREAKLAAYASGLHGVAAERFAALRRAQAAWSQARARDEIDHSGTMRAADEIEEEERQDQDFLAMIERLGAGKPPRIGRAEMQAARTRLDDVYKRVLAASADTIRDWGSVTPAGVRAAQWPWLAYRDAWGAFAAVAYPDWGADAAQAWVTMKRADMLAAFLSP